MAEVVKVQPFRGDIGTKENTDRIILASEAVHEFLLLGVRHPAVQDLELAGFETERFGQCAAKPVERLDAF